MSTELLLIQIIKEHKSIEAGSLYFLGERQCILRKDIGAPFIHTILNLHQPIQALNKLAYKHVNVFLLKLNLQILVILSPNEIAQALIEKQVH